MWSTLKQRRFSKKIKYYLNNDKLRQKIANRCQYYHKNLAIPMLLNLF